MYVTHDQAEVMSLSDRIAVFMHGHLQQVGTPTEIYETPATPEVAGFIGRCNLLEGRVDSTEGGPVQTELGETGQPLRVARVCSAGSSATVGLRSERITLTDRADAPHDGAVHVPRARIEQCSYTGARFEYELSIGDLRVPAESPAAHGRRDQPDHPPERLPTGSPHRSGPKPIRGRSRRLRPHTTPTGTRPPAPLRRGVSEGRHVTVTDVMCQWSVSRWSLSRSTP